MPPDMTKIWYKIIKIKLVVVVVVVVVVVEVVLVAVVVSAATLWHLCYVCVMELLYGAV